jgi:transmembrane sensor
MIEFELFIKYFAGKASPEEAMLIDEWASVSEDRRAFFRSLHDTWLEAGDEIYQSPDARAEWAELSGTTTPAAQTVALRPDKYKWFKNIAAAAAILVVAVGSYFLFDNNVNNGETITINATKQKDSLYLSDGTVITLRNGAEVSYPEKFSGVKRDVQLTGNANFKVAHNPQKPFLVHFDDLNVKVLGTSFEITQGTDAATVRVTQGKVAFYNDVDTIYITAGNTGTYNRTNHKFALISETIIVPATAYFDFKDVPMQQVATRLGYHFKVDIQLQNEALKNCRLSAVFEHKTLPEILTAISETFNLTYKIEKEHIYINGKGCE